MALVLIRQEVAKAGYHIAMLARDKNRLSNLENEIPNSKAFF